MTLGRQWAEAAQPGWVFALSGDLGTGKTQLVKGLAAGWGVVERVHSPTFALIHEYRGPRGVMHHLDLYRLETTEAIRRAGLAEYLTSPAGLAVVEWAERWFDAVDEPGLRPRFLRRVWLEVIGDSERKICHEDFGA